MTSHDVLRRARKILINKQKKYLLDVCTKCHYQRSRPFKFCWYLASVFLQLGAARLAMAQDDAISVFSYDGDGDPDTFSLFQLEAAVNSYFGAACELKKLAEGGYHKVGPDTRSLFLFVVLSIGVRDYQRTWDSDWHCSCSGPCISEGQARIRGEPGPIRWSVYTFIDFMLLGCNSQVLGRTHADSCSPGLRMELGCF